MTRTRALVVDDDDGMRFVVTRALEGLGCEVTAVDDGAEVWDRLSERRFDLLVLDLYMPGMNGFEVLRQIRQQVATPHTSPETAAATRVIVVSAETNPASVKHAKAAGADAFIEKPLALDHFEEVVRSLLKPAGKARRAAIAHPGSGSRDA